MTYTRATLAEFAAGFPAFAAITQDQYDLWVARAETTTLSVKGCLGDSIGYATMLAAAHYLERSGLGTGAAAEGFANGMDGFTTIRSGSLSLSREKGASGAGLWGSTRYGVELWPLLKACFGGPLITGTGTVLNHTHGWPRGVA